MEKLTMSVPEICKVLGVSKPVRYELVRSTGFSSIRVVRKVLISVKELEE